MHHWWPLNKCLLSLSLFVRIEIGRMSGWVELTLIPFSFHSNKYVSRHFHSCPFFFFLSLCLCTISILLRLIIITTIPRSEAQKKSSKKRKKKRTNLPQNAFLFRCFLFYWKYYHRDFTHSKKQKLAKGKETLRAINK